MFSSLFFSANTTHLCATIQTHYEDCNSCSQSLHTRFTISTWRWIRRGFILFFSFDFETWRNLFQSFLIKRDWGDHNSLSLPSRLEFRYLWKEIKVDKLSTELIANQRLKLLHNCTRSRLELNFHNLFATSFPPTVRSLHFSISQTHRRSHFAVVDVYFRSRFCFRSWLWILMLKGNFIQLLAFRGRSLFPRFLFIIRHHDLIEDT